jgi:leader peptidase (prepilin peptidase)/N-methyltransferase
VAVPDWIWIVFIFAFGCCVGSFLNVVIYRLPREKSLIKPASFCPQCGKHIRFYDNIPLVSWLILRAKCRYCKARISARYFIVELLTGLVFISLFIVYFHTDLNVGFPGLWQGGWLVYFLHIVLLSTLIAASAIDLQLWVIPLPICWFATVVGFVGSSLGAYVTESSLIRAYSLLPIASSSTGALAVGAAAGLGISLLFLAYGLLKRSYETDVPQGAGNLGSETGLEPNQAPKAGGEIQEMPFDHRREILKEVVFLLPIIACSLVILWVVRENTAVGNLWDCLIQRPVIAGLLGSVWGYFVGCAIVWATRVLGTLAFGKEAMGLGDVHLMGAAGAVIGPVPVVVAFFVAPFFGLAWAAFQMFFRKTRQIPYGPFLSLGIFAVMILHDWIYNYLALLRGY